MGCDLDLDHECICVDLSQSFKHGVPSVIKWEILYCFFQTIYGFPKVRQFQSTSTCQSMEMIHSITLPWEARNSMLLFARGSVGEIIKLAPVKRSANLELVLKLALIILYPLTLK